MCQQLLFLVEFKSQGGTVFNNLPFQTIAKLQVMFNYIMAYHQQNGNYLEHLANVSDWSIMLVQPVISSHPNPANLLIKASLFISQGLALSLNIMLVENLNNFMTYSCFELILAIMTYLLLCMVYFCLLYSS